MKHSQYTPYHFYHGEYETKPRCSYSFYRCVYEHRQGAPNHFTAMFTNVANVLLISFTAVNTKHSHGVPNHFTAVYTKHSQGTPNHLPRVYDHSQGAHNYIYRVVYET